MQRDKFMCQHCFSNEKELHVHHRYYLPKREIHDYPDDALTTLCFECHEQEEQNLKSGKEELIQRMKEAGCDAWHIGHLCDFFGRVRGANLNPFIYLELLHNLYTLEKLEEFYIKSDELLQERSASGKG